MTNSDINNIWIAQRKTSLIFFYYMQNFIVGYIGIVKDATETTARVELHSNCKTISVDRSRINIVGWVLNCAFFCYRKKPKQIYFLNKFDDFIHSLILQFAFCELFFLYFRAPSRGGSVHSRTPMYGSQTPMYGSQTPGSRTPMYGSQTPTHDGKCNNIYCTSNIN